MALAARGTKQAPYDGSGHAFGGFDEADPRLLADLLQQDLHPEEVPLAPAPSSFTPLRGLSLVGAAGGLALRRARSDLAGRIGLFSISRLAAGLVMINVTSAGHRRYHRRYQEEPPPAALPLGTRRQPQMEY